MENLKSDTISGQTSKSRHCCNSSKSADAKGNPRSRKLNRSARANAYEGFARQLRRDLDPRGSLEGLMTDHVIQCAWRLKQAIDRQVGRIDDESPTPETPKRSNPNAAERASRSLGDAIESLDSLRAHHRLPAPAIVEPPVASEVEAVEAEPASNPEEWRDRLIFDFDISDASPVVKGTWITVSYVVSLIVDGWNWADILRSHPELSEDDIQTCVSYAMAEENSAD